MKEVRFNVEVSDALEAFTLLQNELKKVRTGETTSCAPMPTFSAFAASLFEDKVKAGDIRSASGRVKWAQTLEHHLLPAFGPYLLDQLRHADIAQWRVQMAEKIQDGTYSPHTVNTWLNVMRVILKAAIMQLELARNPVDGIKNFDTSEHGYTEEEPNALPWKRCPASSRRCGSSTRSTSLSCALASSWGIVPRRCDRFGGQATPPTSISTKGPCSSGDRTPRATR
jgi:hypothetical protein